MQLSCIHLRSPNALVKLSYKKLLNFRENLTKFTKIVFKFHMQTDDLVGRFRAHRSKEGMENVTFLYVLVPGKSVASQLETLLINQLPNRGFRLVNKADGKHRNFGTSNLTSGNLILQQ